MSNLPSGANRALAGSVHVACVLHCSKVLLHFLGLAFTGKNLLQWRHNINCGLTLSWFDACRAGPLEWRCWRQAGRRALGLCCTTQTRPALPSVMGMSGNVWDEIEVK